MRKTWIATGTAVVLALSLTTGCGSDTAHPTASGGLDEVKVGVISIVDVAPFYLGIQQGFFTKHRIKVDAQTAQGGAVVIPAVVSGQWQFGFSNVTSLLVGRDRGLPLKVVAAGNYTTGKAGADFGGVVVPADSPLRSPADLAGHTVAVNNLKNIGDTTVRESVRKAGGDPTTLKFVEISFPDAPAALQSHQVDAAWIVEPFLSTALAKGNRVVAWNLVDADPNLMIAAYFTSEQVTAKNPDLVARFKAAVDESLTYAQLHPEQARAVLKTYTKIDPTVAAKITLPRWTPDINKDSVQRLADLAKVDGLFTGTPDIAALLPS
jgi:NitT/TauT family transport system substrate-binding protein